MVEARKLDEQLQVVSQVAGLPDLSFTPSEIDLQKLGNGMDNPSYAPGRGIIYV